MALDDELAGLDPVELMEQEANRIAAFAERLPDDGWNAATRCDGWTVRDLMAHLEATEDYFEACLDGTVAAFIQRFLDRGASDIGAFNDMGIADRADVPNDALVASWKA